MLVYFLLLTTSFAYGQEKVYFTNKAIFTKTGIMSGVRLVVLLPAPTTNEYQEISALTSNLGEFIDTDNANKVLFYDGSFLDNDLEVSESFIYTSKPITIDFNDKTKKNVATSVDPNLYLDSDGVYVDIKNQSIKQIADKLWEESTDVVDYAKRCYEYIALNFIYINGTWRTLSKILEQGGGECGDFSTLFVNLMIYKGIPARHNMGVWTNGGYHVWPDFYHEEYGWIPVDPTFKNSNPEGDYFGRYDGKLIVLSQGLTTFSQNNINISGIPLQSYYYWYWYNRGTGEIKGVHKTSKDDITINIKTINSETRKSSPTYNINGIRQLQLPHGIIIKNGKKLYIK